MKFKQRPKFSISVSPMPPFLALKIELPSEVVVGKRLRRVVTLEDGAAAVATVVELLLADQYTDGDALGAWSRAYPGYLHHVFGGEIPVDVSLRESITCSSWIARGLYALTVTARPNDLALAIQQRIDSFILYLLKHQDEATGGFGIRGRPTSRGGGHVSVDFRHTSWAMLSLIRFGGQNATIDERLGRAAAFIRSNTQMLLNERAITYAVLHQLLSTDVLGHLVFPQEKTRHAMLKTIEANLVKAFDSRYGSWDTDKDPPARSAIDNALFVLHSVPIANCLDSECAEVMRSSYEKLMQYMQGAALPFDLDGGPNVGATAMFAFLLTENRRELGVMESDIDRLTARVVREVTTSSAPLGYPWHLAQFLRIAGGES